MKVKGTKPKRSKERYLIKKHEIMTLDPDQLDQYFEDNINSVQDAKEMIKLLAKVILYGK